MTSKTKRWLMSLPLAVLPFTVAPMEAEAGLGCFASVNFTEGGLSADSSCVFAIVDNPGLPLGTQHIVDSTPLLLPYDLHTGVSGSSGLYLEEFVNDAGHSMTGLHVEWEVPIDLGIFGVDNFTIVGDFFDTIEILGTPSAATGVWFTDSTGKSSVHTGESFFLVTDAQSPFFTPTTTILVHAEIPEPATLATFGFGLAGLGLLARRRRKG